MGHRLYDATCKLDLLYQSTLVDMGLSEIAYFIKQGHPSCDLAWYEEEGKYEEEDDGDYSKITWARITEFSSSTDEPLHGHPMFYDLSRKEQEIHSKKNYDYAQGGKPTGNFDRVAEFLSLYPGLNFTRPAIVSIVYMLKQLDAALWMLAKGHGSKTGEGVAERLFDVGVYAKLIQILLSEENAHS